jgi:methyl coenzyme M reductase subunit D
LRPWENGVEKKIWRSRSSRSSEVQRVVAQAAAAGLQVAVVHGEQQPLRVHVGDQVGQAHRRLHRRVRQVAPQADRIAAAAAVAALRIVESVVVIVRQREAGGACAQREREAGVQQPAGD